MSTTKRKKRARRADPTFDRGLKRLVPRRLAATVKRKGKLVKSEYIPTIRRYLCVYRYRGATFQEWVRV